MDESSSEDSDEYFVDDGGGGGGGGNVIASGSEGENLVSGREERNDGSEDSDEFFVDDIGNIISNRNNGEIMVSGLEEIDDIMELVETEEEMFDAVDEEEMESAREDVVPDREAPAGQAEGEPASDTESTDEETEQFDISLAASHSYMGGGLQPVRGRSVLEAGWEGAVPVLAHHGAVFPGETVPMLVGNTHDIALLEDAIDKDKLFGLLCPDESGALVSGYGVLCEVFEAARAPPRSNAPQFAPPTPPPLSFKARACHRFRLHTAPKHAVPINHYNRMRYERIRILPEIQPGDPLQHARLLSLDPLRRGNSPSDRRLRTLDAAGTAWPLFVYDIFDYRRMRAQIQEYFHTIMLGHKLPEEPVSLSFWVARNLALAPRDRLALFVVDNALLRLHMAVKDITRKSVLCCASCSNEIARRDHIFAMSSEGVHSNYTNLGGYMHDIITVSRASNTELTGNPSSEYSWFPGYAWTIAVCALCMAHVGWRFDAEKRSLRPQQFYGLCRNYVTPRAADAAPLPPLLPYSLAPPLSEP